MIAVVHHASRPGSCDTPVRRPDELLRRFPAVRSGFERIWYWGIDGKIEREQIVLRHGRGLVFCQIHGYGADLYVGWDAHLNVGTWREKRIASGVDRDTGERVELMEVEPATQPTTEYDIS